MTVAVDIKTGAVMGQVVNISALTGMIRILVRGGGYLSVMSESVRLEECA